MRNFSHFIIPSIDLLDGQIVRLHKGNYDEKTIYSISIDELLNRYKNFANLHIVDLNGAKNDGQKNLDLIKEIREKFNGKIQVGGGIRSIEIIENMINNIKIDKIVLGTMAINDIIKTKEIILKYGKEKIILALDCEEIDGKFILKSNGWKDFTYMLELYDLLFKYDGIAKYILVTDIATDGTLSGSNLSLYTDIKAKFPNFILQASGGIGSMQDVKNLEKISDFVIIGKAMYENKLINDI